MAMAIAATWSYFTQRLPILDYILVFLGYLGEN
jgi:hypothetical protein